MKKNKLSLLILLVVCMSSLYAFQDKGVIQNILSGFQVPEANQKNRLSKKLQEKPKIKDEISLLAVGKHKLTDKENKADDLGSEENTQHRHFSPSAIKQEKLGFEDSESHVIPLEDQPDVPSYVKDQYKQRAKEMEEKGYVKGGGFSILKLSSDAITLQQLGSEPLEKIYDSLVFEPVIVKGTAFDQGEYLGHKADLGLIEPRGWDSTSIEDRNDTENSSSGYKDMGVEQKKGEFSRYYQFEALGYVKLTERVLPQDGQSRVTPELMNADVNGHYAYYLVQKGSNNQYLSMLTWLVGDRQFILEATHNTGHEDEAIKHNLFGLAQSIP